MKKLLFGLFLTSSLCFAQTDTGEIDKKGRKVYERLFEGASVEISQSETIDEDLFEVFDSRGVFRIGAQQDYNSFPWDMLVKYERGRSLLFMSVKYEFVGNKLVITAKNTIDDLVFPLGVQYYIVVRYTKKDL